MGVCVVVPGKSRPNYDVLLFKIPEDSLLHLVLKEVPRSNLEVLGRVEHNQVNFINDSNRIGHLATQTELIGGNNSGNTGSNCIRDSLDHSVVVGHEQPCRPSSHCMRETQFCRVQIDQLLEVLFVVIFDLLVNVNVYIDICSSDSACRVARECEELTCDLTAVINCYLILVLSWN